MKCSNIYFKKEELLIFINTKKLKMSENIDKSERFIRIAEKWGNNAIKSISAIGNLSNKRNYIYNEKQLRRLFQC